MALQIEHYNFSPVDISPCGTHYIMVKTDTDAGEWVRWKDVAPYIGLVELPRATKTGGIQSTDVQQLKAEILPLLIRALDEGTISIETNDIRGYIEEVVAKLSAV